MTVEELREKWVLDAPYIWGEGWPELKADIEAMITSERERCLRIASAGHGGTKDAAWYSGYMEACREIHRAIESGLLPEDGAGDCYWAGYEGEEARVRMALSAKLAEEREACAKIVDEIGSRINDGLTSSIPYQEIGEAIRARGEQAL